MYDTSCCILNIKIMVEISWNRSFLREMTTSVSNILQLLLFFQPDKKKTKKPKKQLYRKIKYIWIIFEVFVCFNNQTQTQTWNPQFKLGFSLRTKSIKSGFWELYKLVSSFNCNKNQIFLIWSIKEVFL